MSVSLVAMAAVVAVDVLGTTVVAGRRMGICQYAGVDDCYCMLLLLLLIGVHYAGLSLCHVHHVSCSEMNQ